MARHLPCGRFVQLLGGTLAHGVVMSICIGIGIGSRPIDAAAQTAVAGATAPDGRSQDPSVIVVLEDLRRLVAEQTQRLDAQSRELAALRAEVATLRTVPQLSAASATAPESAAVPSPPATQAESPSLRVPELPPDVVSVGNFPGSFRIPGTDAALKIGGLVRVNWVRSNEALFVDDRFVTSSIPIDGTAPPGARANVIASPSRFNFDLRTPSGAGHVRAFLEGDFAGNGNAYRLRHAYGQWRRFVFGQTWSTFSDPEAEPDGIDFEGLNAIVLFRQPQVRSSWPLGERVRLALALEDPRSDVTGATGVSQLPDAVVRVRWEPRRGGHIQAAVLGRQLRARPTDTTAELAGATAAAFNISGRLPSILWPERDHILFQQNLGSGIGRYITDLGTVGGQDAVYDADAQMLRPLMAYSGYIGYEHWWSSALRSSFSFGFVGVNNLAIQPPDALHYTRRSSMNIMWSPVPRLDLVAEFLLGTRVNQDGQRGSATQTQIGSTFRF